MHRLLTALLAALFVTGCATTQGYKSNGFEHPQGREPVVPRHAAYKFWGNPHIAVFVKEQAFAVYGSNGLVAHHRGRPLKGWATTGGKDTQTPYGVFSIIFRKRDHVSNEFKDSRGFGLPMPYTLRFTDRGHAIHAGYHFSEDGQKLESHGCVRIGSRELAGAVYEWAEGVDVKVVVVESISHYFGLIASQ